MTGEQTVAADKTAAFNGRLALLADVKAEVIRINTEARPLALQIALLVPLAAGLIGLGLSFRMVPLREHRPEGGAGAPAGSTVRSATSGRARPLEMVGMSRCGGHAAPRAAADGAHVSGCSLFAES